MMFHDVLKDITSDILNSIDWGSLEPPSILTPEQDLSGAIPLPAIDIDVGAINLQQDQMGYGMIRGTADVTIGIVDKKQAEKYIHAIVKSAAEGRAGPYFVWNPPQSVDYGMIEGTGLHAGFIRVQIDFVGEL